MKNNIIKSVQEFNNIKEIIYNSAEKFDNKTAFTIKNHDKTYTDISYKKLLEDINSFGTELFSMGYKGKRIAIIGKNRYEWVLTYLTNLCGGIVSVPLDKDLQLDEFENSLIRSKTDVIVFDPKKLDEINKIKENGKTNVTQYICMEHLDGFLCVQELIEKGAEKLKSGNREFIDFEIDETAMNVLLFTSGTTSKSKAVMLCQKGLASNIYALQITEDIRPTDTNIAFLPFHHIFGSTCIMLMLAIGVKNVFPDGLRYIKQNLNEYKVTVFVGVPILIESIYKTIMKEVEKQGKTKIINIMLKVSGFLNKIHIDIRRKLFKPILEALGGELRMVVSGGAPADPIIAKGFNNMGVITVQGYGLTETSPVVAAENCNCIRYGSVGIRMPNVEVEVVNKDEEGIGQIRVKGPNVMLGYYEMPEETKEVLKDGWFYTGDLGYLDKDGYLMITGRSKNMIVLKNGKKVFPEELEALVGRLELVQECMVYGMPEKEDESDIKLSVKVVYNKDIVEEKYKEKTQDELYSIIWEQIKEINTTFPRYKHIQNMILTDEELIKTSTKKVKRQEEMKKILSEN